MQTNVHRETAKKPNVDKLQECLRSELSAVETYELALKSVTHVGIHHTLQEIFSNHFARTEKLRERIARAGAEPATSSGVWGAFAKAVQAGADLFGDRTAIAALEDGEDRALKLYTEGLQGADDKTRWFVDVDLLPEQRRTHDLCRMLKGYVNAPS